MDVKYNDFALCTPTQFEQIAKKYNEQINNKQPTITANSLNIANYLNNNILMIEQTNVSLTQNKIRLLQKIYIKTYNLKKYFPAIESKANNFTASTKKLSLTELKNASITNLCMAIKDFCFLNENNYVFLQKAADLICEYSKI